MKRGAFGASKGAFGLRSPEARRETAILSRVKGGGGHTLRPKTSILGPNRFAFGAGPIPPGPALPPRGPRTGGKGAVLG